MKRGKRSKLEIPIGRKLKFGEKTVTVTFRIPASKKDEVKKAVADIISQYEVSQSFYEDAAHDLANETLGDNSFGRGSLIIHVSKVKNIDMRIAMGLVREMIKRGAIVKRGNEYYRTKANT